MKPQTDEWHSWSLKRRVFKNADGILVWIKKFFLENCRKKLNIFASLLMLYGWWILNFFQDWIIPKISMKCLIHLCDVNGE